MKDTEIFSRVARFAGAVAATIVLVGCSTGTVTETRRPSSPLRIISAESSQETSGVAVPASIRTRFQLLLDEALYSENHFQRGSQLKIKWQFKALDEGNRALRYFVGFGAGKGKIAVQARFFDERGRELATVQSEGTIAMGAFGGSYDTALSECADAIAKYARANFLAKSDR
jgi:uncharacterized protein DUF4410